MSNIVDKNELKKISRNYGIIVIIANLIGWLLANSSGLPVTESYDYDVWMIFLNDNSWLVIILSIMSFVIPTLLIFQYSSHMIKVKNERIVNIPFMYAALGCLGWILTFCVEFGCLVYVKFHYDIKIAEIATVSFLNILQESICIFTLTFLIINYVHRKKVLPKLFPEGNLSRFTAGINPSVRFLVGVFYLSVCIFPVFFMTSSLVKIVRNNDIYVNPTLFVVLGLVILFSVIIFWTFCDYFTSPLAKLKQGVQKIKSEDYDYRVDIVSNDDFGELADAFNDMTFALDEKNKKIHAIQNSIIKGMAVMVESRDNSTGGHINRTSDCVKVFVERLSKEEKFSNFTRNYWKAIIKAAPMHDLGKIAVDDAILRKPGKFTDEEYEIMKSHSSEGARIVKSVLGQVDDEIFKEIAINVAHYHHEKWNGTGYPEKIAGEEIPFEARIMALADVFDALVSKRCYKDSFTYDKAFQIIEESLGSHFDPELGHIFIECRAELEALYDGYASM